MFVQTELYDSIVWTLMIYGKSLETKFILLVLIYMDLELRNINTGLVVMNLLSANYWGEGKRIM